MLLLIYGGDCLKKVIKKIPNSAFVLLSVCLIFIFWGLYQHSLAKQSSTLFGSIYNVTEAKDGDNIYAAGTPLVEKQPKDILTGVTAEGPVLVRQVQVYQYYLYDDICLKSFCSEQKANIKYKGKDKYENPQWPEELKSAVFLGKVTLNGVTLGEDFVYTLSSFDYDLFENEHSYISIEATTEFENSYNLKLHSDGCYYSGDPDSPQIGDIKISYLSVGVNEFKEITAVGTYNNGIITHDGPACMFDSIKTVDEAAEIYGRDHESTAYGLYFFGFCFLVIAIAVALKKSGLINSAFKGLGAIAVVLLIISYAPLQIAKADFGDYGGGADYGGYDYGGYDSGGYDSGGYDNGGYYNKDDDYERTTTLYRYGNYADGTKKAYEGEKDVYNHKGEIIEANILQSLADSSDNSSAVLGFIVVVIIGDIILCNKRKYDIYTPKKKTVNKPKPSGAAKTDSGTLLSVNKYTEIDENFNTEEFKAYASETYIRLQKAWQNKNLDPIRDCLTDAFYAKNDKQLENYRQNKQTNIVDDITVQSVTPLGWKQEDNKDIFIVDVKTRNVDYVIDDETGAVIRGSKNEFKYMNYEFTFVRKKGIKTGEESRISVCPNCGAELNINSSAKCEYCGSLITREAVDWCIENIKGISQRTEKR